MKTSDRGLDMIKRAEGYVGVVYKDQAGLPTIGYGHLLTPEDHRSARFVGRTITKQEAEDILRLDVEHAEKAVEDLVTVPLNQNQFDALVDFTFNLGRTALEKSTLLKKLNAGRYDEVPRELIRWANVRDPETGVLKPHAGLLRRRRREELLWQTPMV